MGYEQKKTVKNRALNGTGDDVRQMSDLRTRTDRHKHGGGDTRTNDTRRCEFLPHFFFTTEKCNELRSLPGIHSLTQKFLVTFWFNDCTLLFVDANLQYKQFASHFVSRNFHKLLPVEYKDIKRKFTIKHCKLYYSMDNKLLVPEC